MTRNFEKVWVFGDSYTTPYMCVDPKDSFWGRTAYLVGAEIIVNVSRPGNSLDSIEQLLVGSCADFNWQKDLLLIGVPPLERITVFDDHKNTRYLAQEIDVNTWTTNEVDLRCHQGLISLQNYGTDRQLILHSDRSWLETQTLRRLWMMAAWLDSKQSAYVIINLSKDLDRENVWGPSEFVLEEMSNHPRCILFQNTYYSVNLDINPPVDFDSCGWFGHHGAAGNQRFFELTLKPKIEELFC